MKYNFSIKNLLCLLSVVIAFHAYGSESLLLELKKQYAPDSRTSVWEIQCDTTEGTLLLTGKVDSFRLKEVIDSALNAENIEYKNNITVLEGSLPYGWALVKLAVASLRTAPRHPAELATQACMGTPLRLLEKEGEWYRVKMPDEYIAYIPETSISLLDDCEFSRWQQSRRVIVTDLETSINSYDNSPYPVSDLQAGCILEIDTTKNCDNGRIAIVTPDGRQGYLDADTSADFYTWANENDKADIAIVEHYARLMLGRGYLWGGTTPKIADCSGLTKIAYFATGIILGRDASQQVNYGAEINSIAEAKKGDLIFFGNDKGRIDHVGIYLGDEWIIHCSGEVKINSLNPTSSQYYANPVKAIRRIVGMENTTGIALVKNHLWYFNQL